MGPPPRAKALGASRGVSKDVPISEVPAVEKGGRLEEVARVMEDEGDFKGCLGEIVGPGQGRVLHDNNVPREGLWERETKGR